MAVAMFNYKSVRAQKARISAELTDRRALMLDILAVTMMFAGICAVVLSQPFGWMLIGLCVIPVMIVEWRNGELKNLDVDEKSDTIDGLISGEVLGLLSRDPTPYEVATVVGSVYGGHFFAVRFGVSVGFLQQISSNDKADMPNLWKEALDIKDRAGVETITAGVLVASLISLHKNHENLLAHLQLGIDDIVAGVKWKQRINDLIEKHSAYRKTGGIARDWMFGWIPSLSRFGTNISQLISSGGSISIDLASRQAVVDEIIQSLSAKGGGAVALVGQDGIGKITAVYALADKLLDGSADVPSELKFNQVFVLDASNLISSAPGRGELEGLIMEILGEAYDAKNIIVCFDNAQNFFENGLGSVDMSSVLMPVIKAGRLPIMFTMDEQRYLEISKRNSQLASGLNRINIKPPSKEETVTIMQDELINIEFRKDVTYMYQALLESYRLSERYVHDLAMPGRAIKLLELAADYSQGGLVTALSVQQAIEKTSDIKVGIARGDDEREKLLNLEDLIHKRMINQTRAVGVVSDALRRSRAGVGNQDRPIGTFLFLGPTGVGKTELAKALAEVYFGGEDKLIRLDMNEYVSSKDVDRLIADGAEDSMSLTARVMKKPFSVVLLDEIEKAHPNVLTTLLQMLDEGILRDIKNREVSFRDTIIIATSNAGADRIREHIARGIDIEKYEDQFINELIDSNQFRSEFLNRFDEIVLFRPLKKEELLQVVDLIIAGVNKTLELQKVSVEVALDAKEYLVDAGYDPRLGARPMRRVVQRAVENIVAKGVLSGKVEPGSSVEITLEQVRAIISSKKSADEIAGGGLSEDIR